MPRQPEPQTELQAELPTHEDELPVEPSAPVKPTTPVTERDVATLARHLQNQRQSEGGHRVILTGEPATIDASVEALELSKAIADDGQYVLLIDWSPRGEGWAEKAGLDASKGFNDLLRGHALFDQIIQRVPGSSAHAIASGSALADTDSEIDPDQLNLILDALDEAYDHIIVAGRYDEARKLFEIIEGRFDAGIVVVEAPRVAPILEDVSQTFLGFDVADIDLIRFERQASAGSAVSERIARVTEPRSMRTARRA
jgi:Mrp family chromosome partitioning ATPase